MEKTVFHNHVVNMTLLYDLFSLLYHKKRWLVSVSKATNTCQVERLILWYTNVIVRKFSSTLRALEMILERDISTNEPLI